MGARVGPSGNRDVVEESGRNIFRSGVTKETLRNPKMLSKYRYASLRLCDFATWILLLVAIFVVYIVLGILYESYIHPSRFFQDFPRRDSAR